MYTGWTMVHPGVGLAAGSGWILATVPGSALLVHRAVRREERTIETQFGAEFVTYRTLVTRYLPMRRWLDITRHRE